MQYVWGCCAVQHTDEKKSSSIPPGVKKKCVCIGVQVHLDRSAILKGEIVVSVCVEEHVDPYMDAKED